MYHVVVFITGPSPQEAHDQRDFAFGTWKEIGLWLDHYGYNNDAFRVEVTFSEPS